MSLDEGSDEDSAEDSDQFLVLEGSDDYTELDEPDRDARLSSDSEDSEASAEQTLARPVQSPRRQAFVVVSVRERKRERERQRELPWRVA